MSIRFVFSSGSFSKSYNSLELLYSFTINFHFDVLTDFVLGTLGGSFSSNGFHVSEYAIFSVIFSPLINGNNDSPSNFE